MFTDPISAILFFGFFLKLIGFLARNELVLRLLVMSGLACDFLFYGLQTPAIWQSVLTNGALIAVNLALLGVIVLERTTLGMTARDKDLYTHFATLTPGQFRSVVKLAAFREAGTDEDILIAGAPVETLFFVRDGRYRVGKAGTWVEIEASSFIGEVVFLRGGTASADVTICAGSHYVAFPAAALKSLMEKRRNIANGLTALIGADLAEKVAKSVPIGGTWTPRS